MVGVFATLRERGDPRVFVEFVAAGREAAGVTGSTLPVSWPEALRSRVSGSKDGVARIAQVARLVVRYARSLNLTGAEGDQLWRQIGEGVAAVVAVEGALGRSLNAGDTWIDIGSGGGFPGLVIGALSDASVLLVEPREKRVAFLELGMGSLGRRDAPVFRGRLEGPVVVGRDGGRFETALEGRRGVGGVLVWGARAVFAPEEWVARVEEIRRPGERVVLHLGTDSPVPGGFEVQSSVVFEQWRLVVGVPS